MKIPTNKKLPKLKDKGFAGLETAQIFELQERLDRSQWMTREELDRYQLHALKRLVEFAAANVAAYDGLKAATILKAGRLAEALALMPILERSELAADPHRFQATALPAGHKLSGTKRSSGTTGAPVSVETTNLAYSWQNALTFRSYLWSGWDFAEKVAGIRYDAKAPAPWPDGVHTDRWDAPTVFPFPTGPGAFLGTTSSLEQQWDWLERMRPAYLVTYPSIVRGFAARAKDIGHGPSALAGIRTVGETVDADLRDECRSALGADIHDIYSAEEIGLVACQCPSSRRYHGQDECVIVEIVDDAGKPCRPGEVGRVVLTPLFNYATPLLRYEIGDIAEAGAPCACGRGLKTINRVLGRQRNLFKRRDGSSYWPSLGLKTLSSMIHIRQHQFRQVDVGTLEVRLATDDAASPELEERMRAVIAKRLPEPMDIRFAYVAEIGRAPGGKYQETVSLVD